jgi:hypothetical protein
MPESVTDRPTKAHEYLYLMSKSERYYYDIEAIKEPLAESSIQRLSQPTFDQQTGGEKDYGPESNRSCRKTLENLKKKQDGHGRRHAGFNERYFKKHSDPTMGGGGSGLARLHATERNGWEGTTRNKRTVWTIPIQPYSEAHFATFPPALIEPCILAGCPAEGIVLDPFMGSGTTGEVALRLNRQFIGFELNPEYVRLANQRIYAGCKPLDCFNDTPIKIEH